MGNDICRHYSDAVDVFYEKVDNEIIKITCPHLEIPEVKVPYKKKQKYGHTYKHSILRSKKDFARQLGY